MRTTLCIVSARKPKPKPASFTIRAMHSASTAYAAMKWRASADSRYCDGCASVGSLKVGLDRPSARLLLSLQGRVLDGEAITQRGRDARPNGLCVRASRQFDMDRQTAIAAGERPDVQIVDAGGARRGRKRGTDFAERQMRRAAIQQYPRRVAEKGPVRGSTHTRFRSPPPDHPLPAGNHDHRASDHTKREPRISVQTSR